MAAASKNKLILKDVRLSLLPLILIAPRGQSRSVNEMWEEKMKN